MNWYTLFYLFSILDKLTLAFQWGAGLCTAGFVVLTICHYVNRFDVNSYEEKANAHQVGLRWIKTLKIPRISMLVLAILFWLLIIFVPARRDMIIIIAGGAVGEFIMHDDNAKELPADITRFLRGEILKATAELTDEAKQSIGIDVEAEKIKKLSREELEKLFLEKQRM
ncbi:MAG: hypothetical protein HC836_39450 [Richelia sp. RM2_1_2]|nr:hypothetical protein [Richelia sp. RM2_1_2]